MKSSLLTLLIAVGFAGSQGLIRADEKTTGHKGEGHLGISIQAVPSVLHSQLGGILPKGQGVLVGQVESDSPAAKAGLQENDILLSFNDQKLYSPEQLIKLVRGAAPGHAVALGFLRGGKTMTAKVMLGQAEHTATDETPHIFRVYPDQQMQKLFDDLGAKKGESGWEMFDAMKLTRLGDKKWRAEIEYRTKDGKKDTKVFTGSREEIRRDIQAAKDLPADERGHLLRALNLQDPIFEFHFPAFGQTPPGIQDHP